MKRLLYLSISILGLSLGILLVLGSVRYGGPGGLATRVQAEISGLRPSNTQPAFVPTPLPTSTPTAAASAARLATAPSAAAKQRKPTATASPTPTAGVPATSAATHTPTAELPSPTLTPTSTAMATPTFSPASPDVALSGIRHAWQTWNNCGPATLAMHLSYFGSTLDQEQIRLALRPHADDKNVNPDELAAFARSQGYQARALTNGNVELLRLLISNGIPVLIETWLEPEPNDGMGHYRLLAGYDDAAREWIAYDSYVSTGLRRGQPYAGIRLGYEEVAELWRVFNRAYVLVYTDAEAAIVESLVGEDLDEAIMWQRSLARAQAEVEAREDDAFAWFNLGTSLTALGRYQEAAAAFDHARILGLPWRMLWYQYAPFRAYHETERFEELLALANATLATTQSIEELHYWRGLALQALGNGDAAAAAWERARGLNPNFSPASPALYPLPTH